MPDLQLPPHDDVRSSGGQREHLLFDLLCEGEYFNTVLKVDDQILVIPGNNSALEKILERPLTPMQTKIYQTRLRTRVDFGGELRGQRDKETKVPYRCAQP